MDVLLVGTSHRHAPLAARERAVASVGDVAGWSRKVRAECASVAEVMVLSTCHRFEIYLATPDVTAAERDVRALVARDGAGLGPDVLVAERGRSAVLHLCRVASGLDSLIVGEAEIAGQVRRAAAQARDVRTMGPYLEAVVAGALGASGRARSQTEIARGVMSAASASVALATSVLGTLVGRTVLVIGAGQTGRLVLARAARGPHGRLRIASRSEHHARAAAEDCGADPLALEDIPEALKTADVVIAAAQSPTLLVTAQQVADALHVAASSLRPLVPSSPRPLVPWSPGPLVPSSLRDLLLIDLSVPRVIDEAAGHVPGARLLSVDDLGDIARRSSERREREVPLVEAIAADEAERSYRRITARRARRSL